MLSSCDEIDGLEERTSPPASVYHNSMAASIPCRVPYAFFTLPRRIPPPGNEEVDSDTAHEPRYLRRPFQKEPDFNAVSVNYDLSELLARAEEPI
jgi:hypothetical protein